LENSVIQTKYSKKYLYIFRNSLHLVTSIVIIFVVAYVLGRSIITKGTIGSDSPLHIAYANWINQFFPQIPHWYPHQGGGESLLHGYPLLAHYLVVIVHRISGLSIQHAFQIVVFLSFPLTALGIYLLGWSVLGRQTVSLIAAVLYLLAPLTWTWIYQWGFLAQGVAMVFVPLGLICFDKYFSCRLQSPSSARQRIWFALTVLCIFFTVLVHPFTGGGTLTAMIFYSLGTVVMGPSGKRKKILMTSISTIFAIGIVIGLLLAFYIVPFYRYNAVAIQEGYKGLALHQMVRLSYLDVFGLRPIDPQIPKTRMANPLVTTVFLVVGSLLAARYSRKAVTLAFTALLATAFVLVPELSYAGRSFVSFFIVFFNIRSNIVVMMILYPILAAFGFWSLSKALLSPSSLLGRSKPAQDQRGLVIVLRRFITPGVSLVLAVVGIALFGSVFTPENHIGYGPLSHGIDLGDIWDVGGEQGDEPVSILDQLAPQGWIIPEIGNVRDRVEEARSLALNLPVDRPLRIDISPYQGDLAKDFTTYTETSDINSYTTQISLIIAMWGYQQNVFYSQNAPETELGNAQSLNQAAKWFGTQYVVLHPEKDLVDLYPTAGWELVDDAAKRQIWYNPTVPDLATATSRPAILVVGKPEVDAYIYIFRLANDGMLPYDDALLVKGQPRIDGYELDALQQFDALILYGYDYKDSQKAWETLAAYVQAGGSLFIDTGWQYSIPEWEFEQAPSVLPVERLTWTNYGTTNAFRVEEAEITGDIDTSLLDSLVWQGSPWSVSGAQLNDVRDWAKVVLSAEGQPLVIAGEYGAGRVVWSGMNLPAHAWANRNQEEVALLHNLLSWLTEGKEGVENPVTIMRDHPDRVDFTLEVPPDDTSWLFWRESVYPNWHAYLIQDGVKRELPIYRSGPGFMLMPIEGVSGEIHIELVWETPMIERLATIISLLTALALVLFVVDGALNKGRLFATLAKPLKLPRKRERPRGSVEWLHDIPTNDASSSEAEHAPPSGLDQALDHTSSEGSDALDFIEVVDEIGDREDVEHLWQQLTEDGKLSSVSDEEVDKLMAKWRNSKTDENE
jgi:hypothetical protein